ncbi:mitochondrial inner membrane protein OXA1L [Rhynochetos jubatus]
MEVTTLLESRGGPTGPGDPPWGWAPPPGPSPPASAQAATPSPTAPVGQEPPAVGHTEPAGGPSPPAVGQDPPAATLDTPAVGLEGEVRLEELGLGAFTPVGLVQNFLQFLHLDVGLPWWGAIAVGTLGARLALLPLLVRGQREAARLATHVPQLQLLSQRLAEARRGTDQFQVARAYSELAAYQKRHDVNPLRGFLVPLVQTPLFVSFFLALQKMAAAPVPGLHRGGLAWFPDLAAPDPYYVLPLLVTASTLARPRGGGGDGRGQPGGGGGAAAPAPPAPLLPALHPALPPRGRSLHAGGGAFGSCLHCAVFTYWLTSNAFSLAQTGLLRVPALRARLGWRVRHHLDVAAKGPLRQTFAHNPLAPPPPAPPAPPKRPWKETLG